MTLLACLICVWNYIKYDTVTDKCYFFLVEGNKKSLGDAMEKGVDLRERILKLYNDYYQGELMKLVVIGGGEFIICFLFIHFFFNWLVLPRVLLLFLLSIQVELILVSETNLSFFSPATCTCGWWHAWCTISLSMLIVLGCIMETV